MKLTKQLWLKMKDDAGQKVNVIDSAREAEPRLVFDRITEPFPPSSVATVPAPPADVVITEKPRAPVAWISARRVRKLPAGTAVLVQRDNGTILETWTLAEPRELGGQPVVDCEGISGPYHLRCVFVREAT